MKNTAEVTGGKPIAVLLQCISGVSSINPFVAFYDIHGRRERCHSFILSRTPHEKCCIYVMFIHFCHLKVVISVNTGTILSTNLHDRHGTQKKLKMLVSAVFAGKIALKFKICLLKIEI
jgi:hypothetical protein